MTDFALDSWERPLRRLYDELAEDGASLTGEPGLDQVIVEELDYARRPPVHERRTPVYGSLVSSNAELGTCTKVADIVDLDHLDLATARRFADGRSSYLLRSPSGSRLLACFERPVQYEADLVQVQRAVGVSIVQRTIMGRPRVFTDHGVVEWDGRTWASRPNAQTYLRSVAPTAPHAATDLLGGILELAVHWLSPARIGTTLVLHTEPPDPAWLDSSTAITAPALSIRNRAHYAALFAVLMQTDLAVTIDSAGKVVELAVGLRASDVAQAAVESNGGMRHRSARWYSFDHPSAVVVVVSEDGPVTVFVGGDAVAVCPGGPCAG